MAKKDWTRCYDLKDGTLYRMVNGEHQADLIALGTWIEGGILTLYTRKNMKFFYSMAMESRPQKFATCAQAEKVARKWLEEGQR